MATHGHGVEETRIGVIAMLHRSFFFVISLLYLNNEMILECGIEHGVFDSGARVSSGCQLFLHRTLSSRNVKHLLATMSVTYETS